jgi:hypothetical protein
MNMPTQNPLEQLRPNHLPDPVSLWPPAFGWWILGLLIIVLITALAYLTINCIRKNRYRKQARVQAQTNLEAFRQHNNNRQFAHDCNRLLKQTALHAYPAEEVAPLQGDSWLRFLADKSGIRDFTAEPGKALGESRYRQTQTVDVDSLHSLTLSWIRKHHA